ncbi:MAG: hypothetical protein L3J96_05190 [Thermoplasmata archaeon]|nr:hypothetical protein [Thermoplasmata archaeon]
MAKKAKRKLEEDEANASFEFPEFDERKFIVHEFEQSWAIAIAFALSGLLGALSYLIDRVNLPLIFPVVVGVGLVALSPFLILRIRPLASEYTKGDWAGLILTEFFGWLGIWFLLLNVLPISA